MLIEIEQPQRGIVLACIVLPEVLHNPSPSLSIVHLCFGGLGPYCGAFTVFLVRPDATRQNDSAFQCAGLACQVGQVGIKVLDLVAK